ncbi:MAG: non-homologous end-joining DNA ligase [Armatimonadota bacterium]|nr:non-homologous end-joining DNA ligase [Armatimonadota bacterium]MDR5702522.1 non-homologous end-joining DNA ligase [Armatimonadota bacterium]
MGAQREILQQLGLLRPGSDSFPRALSPMLASPGGKPFTDPDWLFEVKWDGIRTLAFIKDEGKRREVRLQGRNLTLLTARFPEVVEALSQLPLPFELVLDGEIVALDEEGKPSLQLLQRRIHVSRKEEIAQRKAEIPVVYYLFDLLYVNGHTLLGRPLEERRRALEALIPKDPVVRISEAVYSEGEAFFQAVRDLGLEGMIAKRLDSCYEPGKRSSSWVKVKLVQRQEAVVGGFTRGRGRRQGTLGALLLGVYNEHGELEYIGHTGSGFNDEELHLLLARLNKLRSPSCPFTHRPRTNERPTWVRPELVVEVEHGGWTREGILRFPIYKGIRTDLAPQEVRREQAVHEG